MYSKKDTLQNIVRSYLSDHPIFSHPEVFVSLDEAGDVHITPMWKLPEIGIPPPKSFTFQGKHQPFWGFPGLQTPILHDFICVFQWCNLHNRTPSWDSTSDSTSLSCQALLKIQSRKMRWSVCDFSSTSYAETNVQRKKGMATAEVEVIHMDLQEFFVGFL